MEKINFGIIGLGYIGRRHAEILRGHPDCALQALCDVLPEKAADAASFDVPFHTDHRELLSALPGGSVVCVCTPNGLHASQALDALRAGHHVVMEKPMGLTAAECREVVALSQATGLRVFCVMQNRYSPTSVWLRDLIHNRRLGDIRMVQVNCYWNRDDRYYQPGSWRGTLALDGGPLFTQFSHFVDILFWLFGDIAEANAQFGNFAHSHSTEFEDSGILSFRLPGGGMGQFSYSTAVWDKNFESSLTVVGEKGTVKVGGQYMDRVDYCHVENYEMPELPPANPPNDYGAYKGSAANHHYVFENVVKVLRGEGPESTTAREGLAVVDFIERVYRQR